MPVKVCLTLLPNRKKQKWRYIYNDPELKKYSKGATEVTESNTPDGHKTNTVKYKQSNSLFDKESYVKINGWLAIELKKVIPQKKSR